MSSLHRLSIIALGTGAINLAIAQIALRKLGLILPVDLTSYAFVIVLQFGAMGIATGVALFFPKTWASSWLLRSSLFLKAPASLLLVFLPQHLPYAAALFFAAVAAESLALYRAFYAEAGASLARLNFFIYIGSASGLLFAEKILFRFWGLNFLLVSAVALQIVLAAIAFLPLSRQQPFRIEVKNEARLQNQSPYWAYGLACAAGFVLFAGLIVAYRLLRIYLRDTADVTAEITAISMLIGALVSYRFARLRSTGIQTSFVLLVGGPIVFALTAENLHKLTGLPRELFVALTLVGASATASYLFNRACEIASSERQTTAVLLFNLIGSLAGALLWSYYVVPQLHIEYALGIFLLCFALLSLTILGCDAWREKDRRLRWVFAVAAVVLFFVLVLPYRFTPWYMTQLKALAERLAPGEDFVASIETPQDLWVLTEKRAYGETQYHRLLHNAHSMSGTHFTSRRYMKLMAYLGYLYTDNAKTALNIGFGTGLTAQALLENKNLTRLDVSDVTRAIEPLTRTIYEKEKSPNPLADERLHYHLGGARHFLKHNAEKYDIITGEPPPPSNSSIAYLYTAEFYREILSHLAVGGVFTYWLPTHSVTDASAQKIWQTFQTVFEQSELYAGTESNLIMVGYSGASRISRTSRSLFVKANLSQTPLFARETNLASVEDLRALLIEPTLTKAISSTHAILTDDFSYIEEDYARADRQPWAIPALAVRPQIYAADVAANSFVALVALEKILASKPTLATVEYLLGIDYRLKAILVRNTASGETRDRLALALASYLVRADYRGALNFLSGHSALIRSDEVVCAWLILIDRLAGRAEDEIKRAASSYARARGGVSPVFEAYVERKLPPAFYGN